MDGNSFYSSLFASRGRCLCPPSLPPCQPALTLDDRFLTLPRRLPLDDELEESLGLNMGGEEGEARPPSAGPSSPSSDLTDMDASRLARSLRGRGSTTMHCRPVLTHLPGTRGERESASVHAWQDEREQS